MANRFELRRVENYRRPQTCVVVVLALLVVVLPACKEPHGGGRPNTSTESMSESETTLSEDTISGEAGERCTSSPACQPGLICVALDDPQLDERPQSGVCATSCVEIQAMHLRCLDDLSCCAGTCGAAGVCEQ